MIYTLTLNPAVDKVLFLDELQRAKTNRLTRSVDTIGGKGTHVSINLKLLGVPSIALGISLGETGKKITKMLTDWQVEQQFLHYDFANMESRTNVEIVETKDHTCTMLTERGPMLPRPITDDLIAQVKSLLQPGDALILTGDASNVEDTTIYSTLSGIADSLGAMVFLDASGAYLKEGLPSKPFLIKPNLEELCFLAGRDLQTESDILTAMLELDRSGIQVIAVTWAGKGAMVKYGSDYFRVEPIQVDVINEGGCGDAFLAAIVAGIERREEFIETLKSASAVAAAAAESEVTAGFDPIRAEFLKKQARVTKIIEQSRFREEHQT